MLLFCARGGQGKSVLLKMMAGLVTPDEVVVRVCGEDLRTLDASRLAAVRESFGYLFQNYALFDFMNVEDNVSFPLAQQGRLSADEIHTRAVDILTEVGLGEALALFPNELSGGMKKRVGLARAVISNPGIVLYDDPTAGLDPVTSSKIFELVKGLHQRNPAGAAVVASHDVERMRAVCDRYIMLEEGGVIFDGVEGDAAGASSLVSEFFHTEQHLAQGIAP